MHHPQRDNDNHIRAYAAMQADEELQPYTFDAGPLAAHQVEIKVDYCGLCHSDLSVLNNDWRNAVYPVVAGHEIIGTVVQLGSAARGLTLGQRVGLGWSAESCQHCDMCIDGRQQMCGQKQNTIVNHAGGFADKVRASWEWVIPLPDNLDAESAGPLLCGGITVFNPILEHDIQAMHHVAVIGIGGLGHIAIKLLKAWGCEITAFSSSPDKTEQLKHMGADHVIDSRDPDALKAYTGKFDLILSTVNVSLNWKAYMRTLAPNGNVHMLGVVLEPMSISVGDLMSGQKSVTASATGSPATLRQLLKFAARKNIAPTVEVFPMSEINQAIQHLKAGKARYRVVLKADFDPAD